ncbi:MAG: D-glycero-alpha-D-manno-heptose-1,7-bisphosphate 7-phosphatase [Actinomycetota bacterium]
MTRRFVLLDRDGTINEEVGYVLAPDELRLIAGASEAIRRMRDLGLGIVVLTNQSPVGRGWITEDGLAAIHERLRALLRADGADVDGIEHCPHAPSDGCTCRKPAVGLVERAAAAFGFDPATSFVVGDHAGDMAMGRAVGAYTVFVLTGHGEEERAAAEPFADHVVADLPAAADVIRGDVAGVAG